MKDYLAAVRRLPPSKQDAVLTGQQELVERIESAGNLAWLPIALNLELTDAVFRALGREQAEAFYQTWLKRQMGAPAFSGLVRTALALFRFDTAGGTSELSSVDPSTRSVRFLLRWSRLSMPPQAPDVAT